MVVEAIRHETWQKVTRRDPCRICGKGDWCRRRSDGAELCWRVDTGGGRRGVDKRGIEFYLYLPDQPAASYPEPLPLGAPRAEVETLDRVYQGFLAQLNLSLAHRLNLHQRGLTDAEIDRRSYRTLPVRGRAALGNELIRQHGAAVCARVPGWYLHTEDGRHWPSLAGAAGLVIPVRDCGGRIVALLIRSDEMRDGNRYSYLSSTRYGGPGPGSPVHLPLFTGNRSTVRLTEGALKADISTALSGLLTIGLPGVSSAREAPALLSDLGVSTVQLAFDSDARRNPHVARALHGAWCRLLNTGFAVLLETWPERAGKGIDDALLNGARIQALRGAAAGVWIADTLRRANPAVRLPVSGRFAVAPALHREEVLR